MELHLVGSKPSFSFSKRSLRCRIMIFNICRILTYDVLFKEVQPNYSSGRETIPYCYSWNFDTFFFNDVWVFVTQYTQLCRLIVTLSLNVASSDKEIESWKSAPFVTLAGTTHKLAVTYLGHPHLVNGEVLESKALIFLLKFDEHWFSWYQFNENITSLCSLGIAQKLAWIHQHSHYHWDFSFFYSFLSIHLALFHQFQTFLVFLLLLPLLVVVYQIQPSNVVNVNIISFQITLQ